MIILGIETSCDETAAAVVEDGKKLLSNVVASSLDLHVPYGGVVPEIAARSHLEVILPTIEQALKEAAKISDERLEIGEGKQGSTPLRSSLIVNRQSDDLWSSIDAIAVTQGPGLLGSLLIGVLTARTLAIAKNKPLIAVNHVLAHPFAAFLTEYPNTKYQKPEATPKFPILALIVSGGHTSLLLFEDYLNYRVLGQTTDDAVGEAYDKVAKMLGLPYPGGPSVEKLAKQGNPFAFPLPKAKMPSDYQFSFSGLKTAVLRAAQTASGHSYDFPSTMLPEALDEAQKADLAASFQKTAVETLVDALKKAESQFKPKTVVIAGGVAASLPLRTAVTAELSTPVIFPDIKLCTDNAAMIAALGFHLSQAGQKADAYSLQTEPSLPL